MNIISSLSNPLIKHITSLQMKKYRTQHQEFIAEGIRTIKTLLEAGFSPKNIFALDDLVDQVNTLAPTSPLNIVSPEIMDKISSSTTPSGLLAQFAIPKPATKQLTAGLVLAGISDPGNMGTLIRSAAAMAVKTVVVIEGTDPWSPKVVQASVGTIGLVTIIPLTWPDLIERKKSLKLAALIVSGGQNPASISLKDTLLVVGSESEGIPTEWIDSCDLKITLAMPGNTESLNAAVAGSIALYLANL